MFGEEKMCLPKPPKPPRDNSAEIARKKEEERKAKIALGRTAIDDQFAQFDDDYFDAISTGYMDFYQPQLTKQFDDARRKSILSLAGVGNLNTSAGARSLGNLQELYENNRALLGDSGIGAANRARRDIEAARSDLYAQNRAAADPSAAASSAMSRAGTLTAPMVYEPLGNVFASFISDLGTGLRAERAGYPGFKTGLFNQRQGGAGSSKVIS